jgi:hypothetical protein
LHPGVSIKATQIFHLNCCRPQRAAARTKNGI